MHKAGLLGCVNRSDIEIVQISTLIGFGYNLSDTQVVREPAILLIKWLRPKGLKVFSYVEKYAEFKNQTLKKIGWYTKMLQAAKYPGVGNFSN